MWHENISIRKVKPFNKPHESWSETLASFRDRETDCYRQLEVHPGGKRHPPRKPFDSYDAQICNCNYLISLDTFFTWVIIFLHWLCFVTTELNFKMYSIVERRPMSNAVSRIVSGNRLGSCANRWLGYPATMFHGNWFNRFCAVLLVDRKANKQTNKAHWKKINKCVLGRCNKNKPSANKGSWTS